MDSKAWKQSMALIENGLRKAYVFSMEDKMVAGAFGCAMNYGWEGPFKVHGLDNDCPPRLVALKSAWKSWVRLLTSIIVIYVALLFFCSLAN